MAQNYGPRIVQDGLVMCLDPSQNKSYPTTDLPLKDGLIMWMDAADDSVFSYSSGTTVSQWRDKSGLNYHMVPASAGPTRNAFQNSRKVLAFTTSQNIQNLSIDLRTSPYTVFVVSRYTSPSSGTARILTSNSSYNNWLLGHWASEINKYYANGWVYSTYTALDTNWKLYLGDWGGPSNDLANFYGAGTAIATNSADASAGPWTLGINVCGSELSNCEVAEIIVYNRLLTPKERNLVHTYLGQKWSISNTDRTIIDLSGNDDNGSVGDAVASYMPLFDYYNKGFKFDGSNDYIKVGVKTPLQTNKVTIAAFFKTINKDQSVQFIAGYGDTGVQGYWIGMSGYIIRFNVGNGTSGLQLSSGITPNNDQIYYVVGTYDGVNQKIYVDGVLQNSSTSITGNITYTGMTEGFLLGQVQGYTAGRYLTGNIYHLQVYNRALSADEIMQNYQSLKTRFTNTIVQQGLVLNLDAGNPFSYAGAGTTWYDVSGTGNNGILTNGPTYADGSILFDGVDDYVTTSFTTTSGQAVSYCGWLYSTESTATYRNFIDSITVRPMIWWNNSGQIEFDASYYTTTTVYRNQWVYVSLSKPSGNSSASYYVNGVLVGTGPAYTTPALTPTLFNRGTGQTWKGNGAIVQIYNVALSAAQVLQNYNATKGRYGL
jgi:hypothetical protein